MHPVSHFVLEQVAQLLSKPKNHILGIGIFGGFLGSHRVTVLQVLLDNHARQFIGQGFLFEYKGSLAVQPLAARVEISV